MVDWKKLQAEHAEWVARVYPDQTPDIPAAGMVEEAGELLHAALKVRQAKLWGDDPRHGDLHAKLIDAVGDCAVYAVSFCNANGNSAQFGATPVGCVGDVLFSCVTLVEKAVQHFKSRQYSHLQEYIGALMYTANACNVDFDSAVDSTWARVKQRTKAAQRPRVVCLCGSTRFMQAFYDANMRETLAGRIILSVCMFAHGDYRPTPEQKVALDALHKRKIDMADEVLVLDCSWLFCEEHGFRKEQALDDHCPLCSKHGVWRPYIGDSTRSEIEYAVARGKRVRYLSEEQGAESETDVQT